MATDLLRLWRVAQQQYGPDQVKQAFEAKVRQLAPTDLLAYGLYVHGHEHRMMRDIAFARHAHVMATTMERHKRTQRVTFPEAGKTTVSRWKAEQWLGQQTELAFKGEAAPPAALYLMNTSEQAQKQCMTIAATLESSHRYHDLFPHVQPAPSLGWTKDVLFLKRPYARPDPSLLATGLFGPYQGYRFGLELVDDPTDQEDARSEATMDKQRERFTGTLLDRLVDGGECHVSSTRWGKRDIPEMLLGSDEWASEIMPCYGYWEAHSEWHHLWEGRDIPKALWPEVWTEQRLEKKRQEKELTRNSSLWQLSYLCNPVLAEGQMFRREWLRWYEPEELEELVA